MKLGIRIVSCVMLMAIAFTMLVFSVADFRDGEGYVLGQADGNIAVYRSGSMGRPIEVTDIELGSLRSADREKILAGIPAADERQLRQLLEDLGS